MPVPSNIRSLISISGNAQYITDMWGYLDALYDGSSYARSVLDGLTQPLIITYASGAADATVGGYAINFDPAYVLSNNGGGTGFINHYGYWIPQPC